MFVRYLPASCNDFTTIECVNLACKDMRNPKRDIPIGFITSVLTQAAMGLALTFALASMTPGIDIVSTTNNPLAFGYARIFNCSQRQAVIVSFPASFAAAYGRMFAYGRQISSMGKSGMLHPFFGKDLESRHTPFNGLVLDSVLGYGMCLLAYFQKSIQFTEMLKFALLGSFTSFVAQLCSFIMFQGTFSNIRREFISPAGIPGAVYAIIWFVLCFISIAFFQDNHFAIEAYAAYTGTMVLLELIKIVSFSNTNRSSLRLHKSIGTRPA